MVNINSLNMPNGGQSSNILSKFKNLFGGYTSIIVIFVIH